MAFYSGLYYSRYVLQASWQKPKRLFHKCRTFCSGHAVIFWYKSVYYSNPSLRASSLFWGNREKLHESRSLASSLAARFARQSKWRACSQGETNP